MGLLSYELAGEPHSKLPYTYAITPISKLDRPSSIAAALRLMDLFNSNKPPGCPGSLLCCMDFAFSSAEAFKEYQNRGCYFGVTMNAAYHPEISTALQHDLQLYESRMLYKQQSGIVLSAYSTQFQATPKQHLKGAGAVPHS